MNNIKIYNRERNIINYPKQMLKININSIYSYVNIGRINNWNILIDKFYQLVKEDYTVIERIRELYDIRK